MKEDNGAVEHSCPLPSSFVIYCLDFETQSVVFMEMEPGANLLEEPFMDRGVRQLAGKHVLVASSDTWRATCRRQKPNSSSWRIEKT